MVEQRKLRVIKSSGLNQQEVLGITIPPSIGMFYKNVYFNVVSSGNSIILTSGTKFMDVSNISLEDYKYG